MTLVEALERDPPHNSVSPLHRKNQTVRATNCPKLTHGIVIVRRERRRESERASERVEKANLCGGEGAPKQREYYFKNEPDG